MPDTAFAARFSELLGDAWVALEDYEAAEAAYIAALNDNPQTPTVDTDVIQLKINDLPADPDTSVPAPRHPDIARVTPHPKRMRPPMKPRSDESADARADAAADDVRR